MKNFKKALTLAAYPVIWALCLAYFWINYSYIDAMGYSILVLYLILPVTGFVVSFIIAKRNYLGKFKFAVAPVMGIMYMLSAYLTFSLANMIAFDKFNKPSCSLFVVGAMFSIVGLGFGLALNANKTVDKIREKKENKSK